MDTIIYRKSDKLIAGYVFPRRTEQQTREAVIVEVNNIVNSELGGIPEDYATLEVPQSHKPGKITTINQAGGVVFIDDPAIAKKQAARASAAAKLRALGLTQEELKAFWPKELEGLDERIKNAKKGL